MKKGGWQYSVVKEKCPRCQKGEIWEVKNIYKKGFSDMLERCSECNLKYTIEQGFWYGAMYISYAFGVAITVTVVVALTFLTELNVFQKSGIAVVFLVALVPFVFRYSRNIWINIFVHFDKKYLD
ncbi:MAG: hypothetical protein ACJA0Q_000556 [Saprospiraceae bacterium]|jgi:uncharacterized protein (DUF983 family)